MKRASSDSFGILIDAGSTGSRIFIYKWQARRFHTLPPDLTTPVLQHQISKKVEPGISSCVGNLTCVETTIGELLDYAKHDLQGITSIENVPCYLTATAGMRIVPPEPRELIMQRVRDVIRQSGFLFEDDWARVISGEEEALFGWITVNSFMNTLINEGDMKHKTYGALDLGGASTQISFASSGSILANFFPLRLSKHVKYNLYTQSYLFYGQDAARNRAREILMDSQIFGFHESNDDGVVIDPCSPLGHSYQYTLRSFHGNVVTFEGSSDVGNCTRLVDAIVNTNEDCFNGDPALEHGQCGMEGEYQARIPTGTTFLAFSAYPYVREFLQLSEVAPLISYREAATEICSMDKIELEKYNNELPNPQPNQYLFSYCFASTYVYTMLTKGFRFPDDTTNVKVVGDVNGNELNYAFGAMLFDANFLTWQYIQNKQENSLPFTGNIWDSHIEDFYLIIMVFSAGILIALLSMRLLQKESN